MAEQDLHPGRPPEPTCRRSVLVLWQVGEQVCYVAPFLRGSALAVSLRWPLQAPAGSLLNKVEHDDPGMDHFLVPFSPLSWASRQLQL